MNSKPLLIVIAGAARGHSMPLDASVTIGRDDSNVLAIADPALSRHHCRVDCLATGLMIRDLASKNGVFVNGCPITERPLSDGDQIRIGDSAMLVVVPRAVRPIDAPAVAVVDTPLPITSTVAIDAASSRYLRVPGKTAAGRDAANLAALLRLSEGLQKAASADALHDALLTHAIEAFDVDLAAIAAAGVASGDIVVVAARAPGGGATAVNGALASRAMSDRSAVLTHDHPAMCAPLAGPREPCALLVARAPGRPAFTEDDLQVLAAMASLGGLALDRVHHLEWLAGENERLRHDSAIAHNLVGESPAMQTVFRFVSRVAATNATVLLQGESGTGKELVASAIHANSSRANGPFVVINCAALPEALLESELFGHERGAFTGAVSQQRGRLELADRGTVFLDEIGELVLPLQAKLLRVLQNHVVERVGARRGIPIDVRVIAATNRDLEQAMRDGGFREDLYYRLNVVSLTVPPLRERRGDLPLLSAYFVRLHAARCKRVVKGIAPEARALLERYDWPGNVRELSNAIERGVVLGSADVILPEDLPEALFEAGSTADEAQGFHARVANEKREIIRGALDRNGGSVARAARELALQPTYLHRLIRNLGVRS
jgi:transcriptional regulator with GAF, ATPase, and Fis domain